MPSLVKGGVWKCHPSPAFSDGSPPSPAAVLRLWFNVTVKGKVGPKWPRVVMGMSPQLRGQVSGKVASRAPVTFHTGEVTCSREVGS